MRYARLLLLLAVGCTTSETGEEGAPAGSQDAKAEALARAQEGDEVVSDPSDARDHGDLDPYCGLDVTLEGTFGQLQATHGVVILKSGLRVTIPHFDLFARGDDWLKYVGHPCAASGVLHTYTRDDVNPYLTPTLDIRDFQGWE